MRKPRRVGQGRAIVQPVSDDETRSGQGDVGDAGNGRRKEIAAWVAGIVIPLVVWLVLVQTIYGITAQGPAGTDPLVVEMIWAQRVTNRLLVITAGLAALAALMRAVAHSTGWRNMDLLGKVIAFTTAVIAFAVVFAKVIS